MERKSDLLQKNSLFYDLFENSRIGQVLLDDQIQPVYINRRMYEFFDLEPDNAVDMPLGEIFHCSNFETNCPECIKDKSGRCDLMHAIKILQNGGMIDNNTIQFSFMRESQREIKWFQLNGNFFPNEERHYIQLIFTDITDLKQREKRLKELLSLDLATGTINKYGLLKSVKRCVRAGSAHRYSLCMIDFDNFKQLNDQYGHLFGDKVLEKFADIAHQHIRKDDILGRYGGEEFVFIFDGLDEKQSFLILRHIHTELVKYFAGISKQPVTFSAGIITMDSCSPVLSYKELLGKVDNLLYKAKKLGRSRAMSPQGEGIFAKKNQMY